MTGMAAENAALLLVASLAPLLNLDEDWLVRDETVTAVLLNLCFSDTACLD